MWGLSYILMLYVNLFNFGIAFPDLAAEMFERFGSTYRNFDHIIADCDLRSALYQFFEAIHG